MATGQIGAVFRHINRLFGSGTVSGLTEAQLLARFIEKRDEAAFEALVSRFGPMVLGVCRQMLSDPHAADDAFQATFLVLVKRARSIRDRELLGNWLYGVALKVAKRSRMDLSKRRSREQEGPAVLSEPIGESPSFEDLDLGPILHEELAKLAEKYRAPMVLCFLDGQTCEQAAERLGWPVGTVKGRISRAKDLLREGLLRRGVTASTVVLAATLTKTARALVSPVLLDQTVKAAMGLAAGGAIATAGLGSATAVSLAERVTMTMTLAKIKLAVAALVSIGVATTGVALGRQGLGGGGQESAQTKTVSAPSEKSKVGFEKPIDVPKGGTVNEELIAATPLPNMNESMADLAAARVSAARQSLDAQSVFYENGTITLDRLLQSARRYMEAQVAAAGGNKEVELKAIEYYVRVSKSIVTREEAKYQAGQGALPNVAEAAVEFTEARVLLAEAIAAQRKSAASKNAVEAPHESTTISAKTDPNGVLVAESDDPNGDKQIRLELEKVIAMPFVQETPLEEVVKYIRTATTGPRMEQGLPIYIDPEGLSQAEKTVASPIALNLDGIKLKTTLRLSLKQLGLGYYVKHGLLIITNLADSDYKDATQPGWRNMGRGGMSGMMGGGMGGGGMGGRGGIPAGGGGGLGGQGGGGVAPVGAKP